MIKNNKKRNIKIMLIIQELIVITGVLLILYSQNILVKLFALPLIIQAIIFTNIVRRLEII